MFLYAPFNYYINHKDNIKLKIFYYSLEMDKQSKIIAGMSKYVYEKYKVKLDVQKLESKGVNRLTQDELTMVYDTRDYFDQLDEVLTIHDDQINPYGIYKELDNYARNNGKIVTKTIQIKDPDTHETVSKEIYDYYIPNNPNEYVIVIVDHLGELNLERGPDGRTMDLKGTIEKHSDNMRILRNKYGFTLIDVQQQMASKEDQEFYKGLPISAKLEPALHALGESKLTQRKANVVLGLFAPDRYQLPEYRGYNIRLLKDNFRDLSILKNRNGIGNVHVQLYFDGAVNYFKELPKSDQMTDEMYEKIRKMNDN